MDGLQDIPVRKPTQSELQYFRNNTHVSGMATEDNAVILNPFTNLSNAQKESVIRNEKARIYMRKTGVKPTFQLTEKQAKEFSKYGAEGDVKETIAARILSGDPSALDITEEQTNWVKGNLNPVFDYDKVQSIITKNMNKRFVQRIISPEQYPTLDLGKGEYATHKMMYGSAGDKHIVFPSIVQEGDKLKQLDPDEAFFRAIKEDEFIPFDTADEADWFSKNYKLFWNK